MGAESKQQQYITILKDYVIFLLGAALNGCPQTQVLPQIPHQIGAGGNYVPRLWIKRHSLPPPSARSLDSPHMPADSFMDLECVAEAGSSEEIKAVLPFL